MVLDGDTRRIILGMLMLRYNERLNYYYKAKVYYNIDVNSVIVLKDANDAKVYIFNFDTNQQTQDFYDLLCKKVDKVGVSHTESHSVHH